MDNQNQNNIVSTSSQNTPIIKDGISIIFSGDSYGLFVFQKTEKIVKAVYLLTSLMSDNEPMKELSRKLANDMLQNVFKLSDRVWGEDKNYKKMLSDISELISLFDIAEYTKMMSKINKEIINSELKKLSDFLITSSDNDSSAKLALEGGFFDKNYNYIQNNNINNNLQNEVKFENQNRDQIIYKNSVQNIYKGQTDMSFKNINNEMSVIKNIVSTKKIKDKNNRQDTILKMLKTGTKLTIKDFSKNIKGCSEKTIQRELITMLEKGILKKEGERRWSKYFI